jgi:hypothetical protein
MKIKHTLDISKNEELVVDFEGQEEIEVEVDIAVSSWDRDDFGHAVIEDLEFDEVKIINDLGEAVLVTGSMSLRIINILEKDSDFTAKIYAEAESERQSNLLEQALSRREN